jgi:hypothetical protein
LTPGATAGKLMPGASQNLTVTVNGSANFLGPGLHNDWLDLANCYAVGAGARRATNIMVVGDGECSGSIVSLPPDYPPDNLNASSYYDERGIYVTAIKNFEICAIGWEASLEVPQTLRARIYAADGVTRGALLVETTADVALTGKVTHYIPINFTFQACQEYDVAVVFGIAHQWDWWDEDLLDEPYDAGGVIRVRDAELTGSPNNRALMNLSLIGAEPACEKVDDLGPSIPPDHTAFDNHNDRGIYVTAERTISVCSFGQRADLVPPQTVTARVYNATGTTRGALIAEGTADVIVAGDTWHDVPVNVTLIEGQDYNLTFQFGITNAWDWWDDEPLKPFDAGPFRNIDGERFGVASNYALPHYRVGYTEAVGGAPFDLALPNGPWPGHHTTAQDNLDYGAYVTSLIAQEV